MKIRNLYLVWFAFCLGVLCAMPATAQAQCNQNFDIGEVFYNFKKIIVPYTDFPQDSEQKKEKYPEQLKFENFNDLVTDIIKSNFKECLTNNWGVDKTIMTVPALTAGKEELEQIHNPENLTIVLNVTYSLGMKGANGVNFGNLTYFFYRPEVKHKEARIPLSNNSGSLVFFPAREDKSLKEQLAILSTQLKPRGSAPSPFWTPKP